jgi:hypothetical protein
MSSGIASRVPSLKTGHKRLPGDRKSQPLALCKDSGIDRGISMQKLLHR